MTKIRTGDKEKPRTVNTFSSTLFIGQTFHNLSQEMKTVLDFDGSSIAQVNATFNLETPGFRTIQRSHLQYFVHRLYVAI